MKLTIDKQSSVPKVRQIEIQIRDKIVAGELSFGQKLPSMRHLAEELGVSVGVVKQALNTLTIEGSLRSDPKVGVFVSDKKPTKDVVLILPSVELEQMPRIVRGVRSNLPKDFRLIIESAANDFDSQVDIIKNLNTAHISGILLLSPEQQRYAEQIKSVLASEIPCVQILIELASLPVDSATYDGYEMGLMVVEHLVEAGHRRIGFVGTDADAATFISRNQGINAVLERIGQTFETMPKELEPAHRLNADEPTLLSRQATVRLLKKNPELTAIIGENQHITLGVIEAIRAAGKSIPEDISIISMGVDLSVFRHMSPPVTVADEPLEKICRRATQMLIERIHNPDRPFRTVQFPPTLIKRGSVREF